MRPWYAVGARALLDARKQGQMPATVVVVALVPENFGTNALYVRDDMPIARLDWRMLVDLKVWVWATEAVSLETVLAVTHAIAKARPNTLILRFSDAHGEVHDIDVGSGWHHDGIESEIPPKHEFLWWPQRTCKTELAFRLQQALCGQQPAGSYL